MNSTIKIWFKGLVSTFISAAASVITVMIVDPVDFNIGEWERVLTVALVNGIVGVALYLQKSPLPE